MGTRKHVPNIDAVVHADDVLSGSWAGACSFSSRNKFVQLFILAAGFANDVEAVNQYAAVIVIPTSHGTAWGA